ncbi:hypothetical protein DCC39_10360 [Pueribacillus theae]|uniref:Uncharacterized protein n=1 Tax=Pueribacillus theae TaxID=2171751 RepID=A0A2U1K114_9BACI|nr:hypothetical protein [Pueribacillus theae]PWA11092.1 hypothetical protein DCC39_10360 [Pueribacillus theae]
MKVFKGARLKWFVVTENTSEKRELFKLIEKREPNAVYYYPNGERHEQFLVTSEECDLINEQLRSNCQRSS